MKMETMTAAAGGPTRRVFHLDVLPWLVLTVGITASFFLFALVRDSVENVARLLFEREAKDANSIIEVPTSTSYTHCERCSPAKAQPTDFDFAASSNLST